MEIVFIIGIALFILFGPWVLLWRFSVRRKSDRLDDQSRWSDLSARVSGLEHELRQLRGHEATAAARPVVEKHTVAEAQTTASAPPIAVPPAPVDAAPAEVRVAAGFPEEEPTVGEEERRGA